MPIRSLRHNIVYHFETSVDGNQERLREYIQHGLMRPDIIVDTTPSPILLPFANLEQRTIHLHEPFLSFLWAISFSMLNFSDQYYNQVIAGNSGFRFDFNNEIKRISRDLFIWAISLKSEYSDWPTQLPTPTINEPLEIRDLALVSNQLFLDSLNFILYHETAHLVNNHRVFLDIIHRPVDQLTEQESTLIIELENEADNFARQMTISNLENDLNRKHHGISQVIANLAMLFTVKHPLGFLQSKHLDLDHRLHHTINDINFENESFRDFLYVVATIGIQFYYSTFGFFVRPLTFETPREMFNYFLDSFDDFRENI